MGATKLSLTQLELNQTEEIYLKLTDPARPLKDLGEIKIVVTLQPKTQEDKEQVRMSSHFFILFLSQGMRKIFCRFLRETLKDFGFDDKLCPQRFKYSTENVAD